MRFFCLLMTLMLLVCMPAAALAAGLGDIDLPVWRGGRSAFDVPEPTTAPTPAPTAPPAPTTAPTAPAAPEETPLPEPSPGQHANTVDAPHSVGDVRIISGLKAVWTGTAEEYEVILLRDGQPEQTFTVPDEQAELMELMTATGTYQVMVTAMADGQPMGTAVSPETRIIMYLKATGLELDGSSLSLEPGDKHTLQPTLKPAEATSRVLYRTSDATVARVSRTGVVTAVADGTARITAYTVDGAAEDVCTVTVKTPSTMELAGFSMPETLPLGKAYTVEGMITSQTNLKKVTFTVRNADGEDEISASATCSSKSFDLMDIDVDVPFGTLEGGEKTVIITAQNAAETRTLYRAKLTVTTPDFLWPAPGKTNISSPYGWRQWSNSFHHAIDITTKKDPIIAVEDGVIAKYYNGCSHVSRYKDGCGGGLGNYVIIKHDNEVYTVYAHLENNTIPQELRKIGAEVEKGQQVGLSGSSGSSTDYHLHFGIRVGGNSGDYSQDPELYFKP